MMVVVVADIITKLKIVLGRTVHNTYDLRRIQGLNNGGFL